MTNPIPTLPDGTPNLGIISTGGNLSTTAGAPINGVLNIWNISADIAGQTIWYDTGHRKKTTISTATEGSDRLSPDFPVDSTGAIRTTSETHRVAYQVNSSPQQIMAQMAALSYNDPAKFLAIQTMLAQGVWGTVHVNGSFDVDTEKALAGAMSQYLKLTHGAGVGVSFTDYLSRASQTNVSLSTQQAPLLPVTDPASIRAAAQSAATAALGQGLSESQLSQFVTQFQAAQTGAETQTSGTVSAPDLSSQAMQFAQSQEPGAYQANERQSYEDALVNLLSGPGATGRPSMTPVASA